MVLRDIIGHTMFNLDDLAVGDNKCVILLGDLTKELVESGVEYYEAVRQVNQNRPTNFDTVESTYRQLSEQVKQWGLETGKKFFCEMNFVGDALVYLDSWSFRGHARYCLSELIDADDDEMVEIKRRTKRPSEKSAVYGEARDLGLTITLKEYPDVFEVTKCERKVTQEKRTEMTGATFHIEAFILPLPYDTPTELPTFIRDGASDAYIRTIVSRSAFECSYRNGVITKHRHVLRNRANGAELRTNGQTIHRFENTRVSNLTEKDHTLMKLKLAPLGITPDEVDGL